MSFTQYLHANLGQILLIDHSILEPQLASALDRQAQGIPGKTGTQLVQLGYLTLPKLEEALAKQFGVFPVNDDELENLDDFCRNSLPIEILERHGFIIFKQTSHEIFVAMTNPRNLSALEVFKNLGTFHIKIFSISEIRFQYYLYRHFQREIQPGIRNLFFHYLKEKCRERLSGKNETVDLRANLNEMPKPVAMPEVQKPLEYLDPALLGPLPEPDPVAAKEDAMYYFPVVDPATNPFSKIIEKETAHAIETPNLVKPIETPNLDLMPVFEPEFAAWTDIEMPSSKERF